MSSNQKDMLIDHKVITVTPSEPEQEFMDALQDGYDILNSTALPDGSITYVLRKRLRDGAYNNGVQIDPFNQN